MLRTHYFQVASTLVKLDGSKEACWRSECNLGNLVADAMVHCAVKQLANSTKHTVDSLISTIAVWHAGAFFKDDVYPNSDKAGKRI